MISPFPIGVQQCIKSVLWVLFFLAIPEGLLGQSEKDNLIRNRREVEKEIELTSQLLTETRKNRTTSLNELMLLTRQIGRRNSLIGLINDETKEIDNKIRRINDTVQRLSSQLKTLKAEYGRMIYAISKQQNATGKLMFIFAARDFNQAYNRIKYFQQYGTYRKLQAQKITATQNNLTIQLQKLDSEKVQKLALLISVEKEKRMLATEQELKNQTVKTLSQKEKDLVKSLRESEIALRKLQKAIEEIVAAEMQKTAESAKQKGETTPEGFALTPEELILSGNFAANKGKLPWPAERGIITGSFGEHQHPVLSHIKTQNNGIDITTSKGAAARAVFDGVVTNVLTIPSLNNVVIIKHGDFLTVYANLDQVLVSKGDRVTIKQPVGIIHSDEEQARSKLNFQIWKGKELLDPELWIARTLAAS